MSVLPTPSSSLIWMLDDDPNGRSICDRLAKVLERSDIHLFIDPGVASNALENAAPDSLPWLIITDSIGLKRPANRPFCERAEQMSPLTLVKLFSRGAYEEGVEKQLLQWKVVHDATHKSQPEKMLSIVEKWRNRWNTNTLVKLRKYILTQPEPGEPFMTNGTAGDLSLIDVHREIVVGTPLGERLAQTWTRILSDQAPEVLYPELAER